MTTPLWVPLVVAALGFVSTVVGIVVTQIMANRRERASWQRDTDREQQRWQREDQARTFEHRHTAYVEFYEALRAMMLRVYDHGMGLSDEGKRAARRMAERRSRSGSASGSLCGTRCFD